MVSYGSYGTTRPGLGLGDNFGETGAYRIDYSHNQTQVGTIERNTNKLDHLTTGVAFDVAPATRLDLSFDYSRDTGHAYWGTPLVPRSVATSPTGVVSTPDGRKRSGGLLAAGAGHPQPDHGLEPAQRIRGEQGRPPVEEL
ncbi:hypothetical protein G6F65_021333 [Rhizopus arrhizus]|nr:hypothetical protein G6F65_021333 [Rhizopus arrhizus]